MTLNVPKRLALEYAFGPCIARYVIAGLDPAIHHSSNKPLDLPRFIML
jgi:hypothetical protein